MESLGFFRQFVLNFSVKHCYFSPSSKQEVPPPSHTCRWPIRGQCLYLSLYNSTRENENIENWASLVKSLLERLGLGEIWYQQKVFNKTAFIRECRLRLHDQWIQQWFQNVNLSLYIVRVDWTSVCFL